MSTEQTWQIESTSSDETSELAMRIGRNLRGGEVIELIGDLGAGKTTFVRGLAEGMGSNDTVRSPSFTIGNRYKAGKHTLHHLDFYRLKELGIMEQELNEILEDPNAIAVIEWGGIAKSVLPAGRLSVTIEPTGETGRQLTFSCPHNLAYLAPVNT